MVCIFRPLMDMNIVKEKLGKLTLVLDHFMDQSMILHMPIIPVLILGYLCAKMKHFMEL